MITITRWAGRHPLFVRAVLLPVLFYIQGRLAFIAGARLFFDGVSLPDYWVWGLMAIIWAAAIVYPANARAKLYTDYWRIKGLEWVACTAACGVWFYVGNHMAQRFEGVPVKTQSAVVMGTIAVVTSEGTTPETDIKSDNKLKKAYRNYFKQAIKEIKRTHRTQKASTVLAVILSVIAIGLGVTIVVCSIQCSSAGGGAGLGIALGSVFALLGIIVIIALLSRPKNPTPPKEQTG